MELQAENYRRQAGGGKETTVFSAKREVTMEQTTAAGCDFVHPPDRA